MANQKKFTNSPEGNIIKLQNNKTIKQQNNKTQNLIHISGDEVTSQIGSSDPNSLTGTRGASFSYEKLYREEALKLKAGKLPFYVSVSIKGVKSLGARREVNIDVIPNSADKPIFLKSFTVNKGLKWELFRDLPKEEQTQYAWCSVGNAFESADHIKAGKIITRRKFRTVPKFRISNCACITQDCVDGVLVNLFFGNSEVEIVANPVDTEFFTYKGDWKNPIDDMEVL